MFWVDYHWILLMISKLVQIVFWCRQDTDPDLVRYMASLGHYDRNTPLDQNCAMEIDTKYIEELNPVSYNVFTKYIMACPGGVVRNLSGW